MQTGNIAILENNKASCRDMLHCMAQNESAEEAQRPGLGAGRAGQVERGARHTLCSLLYPPTMAPPVSPGPAAHLLKAYRTISWRIHLLAWRSALSTFPGGSRPLKQGGMGKRVRKCSQATNKGLFCSGPLSINNCLAPRKAPSAQRAKATHSPCSPEG